MNKNKSIQAKKEYWDGQIETIKTLVTQHRFRMKGLAEFYECNTNSIATMLHRRGLTLIGMRHAYDKGNV